MEMGENLLLDFRLSKVMVPSSDWFTNSALKNVTEIEDLDYYTTT